MDLGATICTRGNPNCSKCPISRNCNALKQNKINDFPEKKQKKQLPTKYIRMFIIINKKGEVLLEKRDHLKVYGLGYGACQKNENILSNFKLKNQKSWKNLSIHLAITIFVYNQKNTMLFLSVII